MTSEKLRHREVNKYYQSWLDSSVGLEPHVFSRFSHSQTDGAQITKTNDKALIAFAQLGCLRLDAKRSVVQLISSDRQLILAEATRTLSLVSGDGDYEAQDELWFGTASLPRSQGISEGALFPPNYTAVGSNGNSFTAPALVINDITVHEKYRNRAYAGQGVTFYCGVPIVTESGLTIGVYTVIDNRPRDGLKPSELQFMHDMAATVMRHLEVVSSEAARFRGETMVLGLGQFISGAPSLHDPATGSSTSLTYSASPNPGSGVQAPVRIFKGMTISNPNRPKPQSVTHETNAPQSPLSKNRESAEFSESQPHLRESSRLREKTVKIDSQLDNAPVTPEHKFQPQRVRHNPEMGQHLASTSEQLFFRAARILQECAAADGVLFFDAVSANFVNRSKAHSFGALDDSTRAGVVVESRGSEHTSEAADRKDVNNSLYSGASEDSDNGVFGEPEKRMCKVLGYALSSSTLLGLADDDIENFDMSERSLGKLVKIYPQGKIFSLHTDSSSAASDGDHISGDTTDKTESAKSSRVVTADKSRRVPRVIAEELERLVPHARSIFWLPLWDFAKQRWSAGLFLWSRRPDRLVAAQDDLVYLKVFANSIMVEVARLDTAMADTAKSTFIANISHELRTPLHGVLGNLDILQDTKLTDFQQSLVTAIEMCGRTLSDTIDHVLDYSKINQLSKQTRKRNKSSSTSLPSLSQLSSKITSFEEDFDVAAIIEEAVEAAYASHAFQTSGRTRLRSSSVSGQNVPKPASAASKKLQNVHVIMNFDYHVNWRVHSQPSAIRRIVTNLFGNALKYTDRGIIEVLLSHDRLTKTSNKNRTIPISITIKDTGRGMSEDFVRNHAFTPFSQESQFSTGTGLGLSIVQQIVKSLGGRIELQSDRGIGTEIRVFLNLLQAEQLENMLENSHILSKSIASHVDIKPYLQISTAEGDETNRISSNMQPVVSSLNSIAQSWFGLRTTVADIVNKSQPTIVLYTTIPTANQLRRIMSASDHQFVPRFVIVASSTVEQADLSTKYSELAEELNTYIDLVAHPIGPQKLSKTILRCMDHIRNNLKSSTTEQIRPQPDFELASRALGSQPPSKASEPTPSVQIPTNNGINNQTKITDEQSPLMPQDGSQGPVSLIQASIEVEKEITSSIQEGKSAQPPPIQPKQDVLSIQSKAPTKTIFHPRIPAMMPRSISTPLPLTATGSETFASTPIHVLLVDDNDINLTILTTCMKRAQVPYGFAKDGLQATNAFEHAYKSNSPFTHVLMDISMPIMDGIQATREIREFERKQGSLQRVPTLMSESEAESTLGCMSETDEPTTPILTAPAIVIALSGVASESTQLEMLEAGADMFMPKPVKLKELLKTLAS